MFKSNLLDLILSTSGAKAGMSQIEPSAAHFIDFWSQGQKMLKSSLLELILSTSGAKARKCSNRAFWSSFCQLLEPKPETAHLGIQKCNFIVFLTFFNSKVSFYVVFMTFRMAKCHFTRCFWCVYPKNCHFTSCLWHLWIFDVIFNMFLTLSNFEVVFYMCFWRFRKAKCHFTRCFWCAYTKNCHFTSCLWHLWIFDVISSMFLTL